MREGVGEEIEEAIVRRLKGRVGLAPGGYWLTVQAPGS